MIFYIFWGFVLVTPKNLSTLGLNIGQIGGSDHRQRLQIDLAIILHVVFNHAKFRWI